MSAALSRSCCRAQGEGSCRATISVAQAVPWAEGTADGSLLPGLWTHSLAAPGPRVALPLPIVPSWGWAGCQCFTAVAKSVTHFTRGDCRSCACKCTSTGDTGTGDTAISAEARRSWRADSSMPLNTGMWVYNKMEEVIALLLIPSRGLLLSLLRLRRWLLSLGCSVFLSRACCLWNSSAFLLVGKYFVRELIFLHWRWVPYLFHVSYSKGQ